MVQGRRKKLGRGEGKLNNCSQVGKRKDGQSLVVTRQQMEGVREMFEVEVDQILSGSHAATWGYSTSSLFNSIYFFDTISTLRQGVTLCNNILKHSFCYNLQDLCLLI